MLRAELKAVGGRHDGKIIPLEVDRKFLIGREQDCHLRPNSESVSRHHCCFTLDAFCLRLRDLGSTNGTLVNGDVITGQIRLSPGDHVTVGPLEFEVLLADTDDAISDDESEADASDAASDPASDASDETVDQATADSVLDDSTEEPTSGETMIDLPTDMSEIVDSGAGTAILSGDTTVIPNDQQQQLQQQLAMQQQMAMQQQQQQQQLAMQQQMAMQQQLAMQQQMPYVAQPGMMPGMMPPGFAPAVPQAPAEQPAAESPASPLDVTLPDPATTGAKDPEPVEKPESQDGEQASGTDDNPSNVAEDIIKQYMHRRPSTGS